MIARKYDPPYNAEQVLANYGQDLYQKLSADPVHRWRMETGIELIHQEPSKKELDRIWANWQLMSENQRRISDEKSLELFGVTNAQHYRELLPLYESAQQTLTEDIDSMRKYYPNIDEQDFMRYIELDPTYKPGSNQPGRYARWILRLANGNMISRIAHLPDLLRRFEENRADLINRDIMSYHTMSELEDALNDDSSYKQQSKRQQLRATQKRVRSADLSDQAQLLYDTPNWEIWRPDTYEASCKLGRGTRWCTASTEDDYYYKAYVSSGPLFILIKKTDPTEKYQLHFQTGSFMDANDEEISPFELAEEYVELDRPLAQLYSEHFNVDPPCSSLFEEVTVRLDASDIRQALDYKPLNKSEVPGEVVATLLFDPESYARSEQPLNEIASRFYSDWSTQTIQEELTEENRRRLGNLIGSLTWEYLEAAEDVMGVMYGAFVDTVIESAADEWQGYAVAEVDKALDIGLDSSDASGYYDIDNQEVVVECTVADLFRYMSDHMTQTDFAVTDSPAQDVVSDILREFTELYWYKLATSYIDWDVFNEKLAPALFHLEDK